MRNIFVLHENHNKYKYVWAAVKQEQDEMWCAADAAATGWGQLERKLW